MLLVSGGNGHVIGGSSRSSRSPIPAEKAFYDDDDDYNYSYHYNDNNNNNYIIIN